MPRPTVPASDPDERDRSAEGGLAGRLARLAGLFARLGPEGAPERAALAELQARLRNKRFHLAVLGQVKRGKSTLLNALLGEEVLPASVVPLTAIPTVLVSGPERRVILHFADGRTEEKMPDGGEGDLLFLLAGYVSEEANSHNRLGLSHVEVRHPSPLLAGVTLIDTPGIGSTLERATEHLVAAAGGSLGGGSEEAVAAALAKAIPPFFERELGVLSRAFDARVREVLEPHQRRADELLEAVRRDAAAVFEVPYSTGAGPVHLQDVREPYWVTHKWASSLSPLPPGLIERLLPAAWRRARCARRRRERIDILVLHNVENLRWATLQNLDQTFRRFQRELQERLDQLAAVIMGASERVAREARDRRGAAVAEVEARRALAAEIETAREAIGAMAARGSPVPLPLPRDEDGGEG